MATSAPDVLPTFLPDITLRRRVFWGRSTSCAQLLANFCPAGLSFIGLYGPFPGFLATSPNGKKGHDGGARGGARGRHACGRVGGQAGSAMPTAGAAERFQGFSRPPVRALRLWRKSRGMMQ